MPDSRISDGNPSEFSKANALKAAIAELSQYKLKNNGSATQAGLVAASLSHVFARFVAVSIGANISCGRGHVNPAAISLVVTLPYSEQFYTGLLS
ncbi:PREDICTED: aquaporin TIP1-3-like [Lupinus angustifolius]|uniref:aquaporin TIP1-3-like n=1 Tax=Lupinus angustifolius TaxID=3871 RepID=UPI00092EC7D9|nr:PREDICTED: aquaporin TIP1-3-like [Lupinus angustifolius]